MGLMDSQSRWYVELVVHKGHPVTQADLDYYHIPDASIIQELHDTVGCIKNHGEQIAFWRERVKQEKEYGDSTTLRHAMTILAKCIRGHVR